MSVMENLKRKGNIIPVCTSDFEIMLLVVESLNNPYYLKNGVASAQKLRVILMKKEADIISGLQSAQLLKYVNMVESNKYSITEKGKNLIKFSKIEKKISIAVEIFGNTSLQEHTLINRIKSREFEYFGN